MLTRRVTFPNERINSPGQTYEVRNAVLNGLKERVSLVQREV